VAVSFDALDPAGVAAFWGRILGREPVPEAAGVLLPGDQTQVGLRFVAASTVKDGPDPVHLHLTSAQPEDQQRTVDAALELGARHLDVGQLPGEHHVVLADPGGNAFCVIEAGNGWLAGTGFLGELACDGLAEVGQFWAEALGWPLVWDEEGETAIQSPHGGTKIAWGGPPLNPKNGRNRQRFDLATPDLDGEVARLLARGARWVADLHGGVELADPGGNEFTVRSD
jgi:hypothetical protein